MKKDPRMGTQLVLRLRRDRTIAPTLAERRVAVRVVLQLGQGQGLLGHGLVDTHQHLETLAQEADAMQTGRVIASSLQRRLGLRGGFQRAEPTEIRDVWHLRNLLRYLLTQAQHHRVRVRQWYESTWLPDLLGARPPGEAVRRLIVRELPRLRLEEILEWLEVPRIVPLEVGRPEVVLDATLAAAALPRLAGTSEPMMVLRRAALEVMGRGIGVEEAAAHLGVSRSTVRLRRRPSDGLWVGAIRWQLGLREAFGVRDVESIQEPTPAACGAWRLWQPHSIRRRVARGAPGRAARAPDGGTCGSR